MIGGESFNASIAALQGLPNLKKLNMNLEEEPEVQLVFSSLTTLEFLNNQGISNDNGKIKMDLCL